jgi:hypothetical protein
VKAFGLLKVIMFSPVFAAFAACGSSGDSDSAACEFQLSDGAVIDVAINDGNIAFELEDSVGDERVVIGEMPFSNEEDGIDVAVQAVGRPEVTSMLVVGVPPNGQLVATGDVDLTTTPSVEVCDSYGVGFLEMPSSSPGATWDIVAVDDEGVPVAELGEHSPLEDGDSRGGAVPYTP